MITVQLYEPGDVVSKHGNKYKVVEFDQFMFGAATMKNGKENESVENHDNWVGIPILGAMYKVSSVDGNDSGTGFLYDTWNESVSLSEGWKEKLSKGG